MSTTTQIEWTDATWNPVTGCSKITRGCDFCYAERFSERFRGVPGHPFENGFDLTLRPERVTQPLQWRQPRRRAAFGQDLIGMPVGRLHGVEHGVDESFGRLLVKEVAHGVDED